MEFFEGHTELENLLEDEPARVVNELRDRVQKDLASNGHAWMMIGRGLTKLGFSVQGQESISYGESLLDNIRSTITERSSDTQEYDLDNEQELLKESTDHTEEEFETADGIQAQEIPEEDFLDHTEEDLQPEKMVQNNVIKQEYSLDSEAIMLMSRGDYDGAIEAWTRLIKNGETAGRWNGLAESLEALGYSNRANKARLRASSTPEAIEAA